MSTTDRSAADLPRLSLAPASLERRKFPRATARGSATAVVASGSGGTSIAGVSLYDSSPGGLGVVSTTALPVGAEIAVHFGGQPTAGRRGRVTRCVEVMVAPESTKDDAAAATTAGVRGWLIGIDESRRGNSAFSLAG